MTKNVYTLLLSIFVLFFQFNTVSCYAQQQLIHYWNFNDNSTLENILQPTSTAIAGASITHISGGTSLIDFASGTGQNFNVNNFNARNGDDSGTHLRFNNPIGGELEFALPTTNYQNPIVTFATRRSGSGAGSQYWAYSTDGINYSSFDTIFPNDGDPMIAALDFTSISAANDNPNFKIKVSFEQGSGGLVGNNRFDNLTMDANPIPVSSLVHYWNFNDNSTIDNLLLPSYSAIAGASITHISGGTSLIDFASGTGQNFNVNNFNARNGDDSGTHLRFNNPIGGELEVALPTTNYQNPIVTFATRRSGSGAGSQYWAYSADGINYSSFDTIFPNDGDPMIAVLDFTSISAANDNPNFKIKVSFEQGSGGLVGNNRFDNLTMDAALIGGGDNIPPVAVFDPKDNASNLAINTQPTITFNEQVRLVDNSIISDSLAATILEWRENDQNGAIVPFTTVFQENTIFLTPINDLKNNQAYYISLLGNTVEDLNNNAIMDTQSVQFTTIPVQTVFNAGDLVFVAYRMNATSTEDEIALLSFVDIIPGTFINFTDAKYTTNPQPQCPGGIVWTAPSDECITAGTVITIQTDAMTTNKGTISGSGFGLSSGGDQVFVYTGTAANPNYITALSSNGWVENNTSCSGSLSSIPNVLTDGINAFNASTTPGNIDGNSVNAYYSGIQSGDISALKANILNPANWVAIGGSTPPQTWPSFAFPGPPTITKATIITNNSIQLIFNAALDSVSSNTFANYSGIIGLDSIIFSNNGGLVDTVVLVYQDRFTNGSSYSLVVNNLSNTENIQMGCPYVFDFTYNTEISTTKSFVVVPESAGTITLDFVVTNPSDGSLAVVVLPSPYSNADNNDFTLSSQIVNFTGASSTIQIPITIIDDNVEEQSAEYFVVALRNPVNGAIKGDTLITVYIKDNDRVAAQPTKDIELVYVGSFDPSGTNSSTCEVVAYDPISKRLFTSSAIAGFLDIIDFTNPTIPTVVTSVDINPYGGITSVAVKDGIVAVASPNQNEELNGSVLFFDTNGNLLKQVTVGALPDMVVFTHDGTKVLSANEGQPKTDYSVDPEGSVSIINIANGITNLSQSDVTTLDFTAFNTQEVALMASGVRKTKNSSTLAQDFEPEFITIDAESKTAWVTLQENNAIASIDLSSNSITDVWPMGTKDVSITGNGFDVSDNNKEVLIANWPLKAYYIPDALSNYQVGGTNYLITANEGDEKEYAALTERTTVGASNYILDPTAFPNAAMLKQNHNLGRMRVTNVNGDTDGDGDFDEIYCVGTRSFSIWNADTQSLVYDSGDDFELYTSTEPSISPLFNADHESNAPKGRSRAKGPEPEGVTIAEIAANKFAFISLERIGGVMVYNVTDPSNPTFVEYKNSRSTSAYAGDHGPEGILFIPSDQSPNGKQYIIVANEISGTLTIFEVKNNISSSDEDLQTNITTLSVFPNPANALVYLNRHVDFQVFNIMGNLMLQSSNQSTIDVSGFSDGIYFVKAKDGAVAKLIVKK